jgi:hypothetical protein
LKEQGAHENPTKIAEKDTKITRATRRKSTKPWKLPYTQRSDSLQSGEENLCLWSNEMRSSLEGWLAPKP